MFTEENFTINPTSLTFKSFGSMKTSPEIFLPDSHLEFLLSGELLQQIYDASSLEGVVKVVGLPDIHSGYVFPIGCAVGVDCSAVNAVVHPSGIGFDINCGVRSIATNLNFSEVKNDLEKLADLLANEVPAGFKDGTAFELNDLNGIIEDGCLHLVKMGLIKDELEFIEERGKMAADSRKVSQKSKGRGLNQLGSIGGGNHYLEIQKVAEIFDENLAKIYGLRQNQIVISIHTGSRGLGHQICSDFSENSKTLEIASEKGRDYLKAMGAAANYGFANRALIDKKTRNVFKSFFPHSEFKLIFDAGHNIGKIEKLWIDGVKKEIMVHRKGVSRSWTEDLPLVYENTQPVPVGGSMGTCSFILGGLEESSKKSLSSCCHGAGRLHTRGEAKRKWSLDDILKEMEGIVVRYGTDKGLIEEAPKAYKDIEEVVLISEIAGLTKRAVKLEPILVVKG